jgi:hypothetical protein
MLPIKIQCGCGQKYAFEVEPVNGQMPYTVACPVCGVDGTEAANYAIAQSVSATVAQPAPALSVASGSPGGASMGGIALARAAAPPPAAPAQAPARKPLLPGQITPEQAAIEGRAKIFWGDSPDEVKRFLMINSYPVADATIMVNEWFLDRARTIRKNGIKKFCVGFLLATVPVIFYFVAIAKAGDFAPMKLFAVTIMVGLYGAYMFVKGVIMFCAPKSEPGDVSSQ